MYLISNYDKVNERFYFRHEAYRFFALKQEEGITGLEFLEERYWVYSSQEKFGPYFSLDDVNRTIHQKRCELSGELSYDKEIIKLA